MGGIIFIPFSLLKFPNPTLNTKLSHKKRAVFSALDKTEFDGLIPTAIRIHKQSHLAPNKGHL